MKKLFFTGCTGILLTWIVTSDSYSQTLIGSPNPEASQQETNVEKNFAPARLNEIYSRAARDFTRQYKNISDAEWFKTKEGFIVYFTNDDIKCRAYYTKKGHYEGMIRSYFEDNLSREIRHLVKSTYYDFNIGHIYEITCEDITIYIIKLMGQTSWKTVRVINGKIEVIEEYQYRPNSGG